LRHRLTGTSWLRGSALFCLALSCLTIGCGETPAVQVDRDIGVPMRDGVILRADLFRPGAGDRFPVLVYRTPYGKGPTAEWYDTHLAAVERGYAVLIQDVRGRYASDGEFFPYIHEGEDGYDTIEWAATQPWSTGAVGTFGPSYPGAVQWLAAVEQPPHLKAMVPAMTFSTPRRFFYFNGVFDLSWIGWIHNSIAPDLRQRHGLGGPQTEAEVERNWSERAEAMRLHLPLGSLPDLQEVAPFYYEWLRHPPEDPWWDWAELAGRYDRVSAAVLNISGWHDEAYGPEGAATNFNALRAARREDSESRTQLILGPWIHGVHSLRAHQIGILDFGLAAAIDYNELVLRWMDRYVREIDNGVEDEGPVQLFVMGANQWRVATDWPPTSAEPTTLYLSGSGSPTGHGRLQAEPAANGPDSTSFTSNPADPVTDPWGEFGPHDFASLADRPDVAVFDSEPLSEDLEISGRITAEVYLSCDCRDLDLWVKLLDVHPDGRAINLMSPGLDLQRASYRNPDLGRQLLEPNEIYRLRLPHLMTSNRFRAGHRIRVQISGAFAPHFSRNLQTGQLETDSAQMQAATITVYHRPDQASRIILPVVPSDHRLAATGPPSPQSSERR
jgi:putative CocE/NonD family hydrolase